MFLFPYAGKELTAAERRHISYARDQARKSVRKMREFKAAIEVAEKPEPKEEPKEEPKKRTVEGVVAPLSLKTILLEVCEKYDQDPYDVISPKRDMEFVHTRREFIWRARQETNASFTRIARVLRRDHSTVIHAYQQVASGEKELVPFVPVKRRHG